MSAPTLAKSPSTAARPDAQVATGAQLGPALLRAALIAGSQAVMAERDLLNQLNVFPVPDGDTGTNMAFTFAAIRQALQGAKHARVDQLLQCAAMAAIDGARGNSGAIIAQFFYGLSLATHGMEKLSAVDLPQALQRASQAARQALAEPKEGTILSVMQAFADAMQKRHRIDPQDWRGQIATAHAAAQKTLMRTPQQLAVLAEHGVIDAGAQGFLLFWHGVEQWISGGRAWYARFAENPEALVSVFAQDNDHETVHAECASHFRYCSECLLTGLERPQVLAGLAEVAHDSFVFAGGASSARLHLHCDEPAKVFELLGKIGQVSARKADDMWAQIRARNHPGKVAIVCDTGADLPPEEIERLGIHTVHVRVNFGNEEFIDKITLTPAQFYQRLETDKNPVRTSQPPTGEFRRLFDLLASQNKQIVCVNLSSKLSGTWQAANAAAAHGGQGQAVAVDTLNAAAGQALLVLDAAQAAAAGLGAEQIVSRLIMMRARTRTLAVIADLSFAVRGGRIKPWAQTLAHWLRAKVLIANTPAGKIRPIGVLWGERSIPARFTEWALRYAEAGQLRALVGHCNNPDGATIVAKLLREKLGARLEVLHVVEAGTGIGAHAGPGSLVIGLQPVVPL